MEETNMVNTALDVSDYISRPELKAHIKLAIQRYYERVKNLVIPDGCKLKRTPEDYLIERELFHPSDLISEFNLIREKKSSLPSSIRKVVTSYVVQGMYNLYLNDQQKAKEEETQKALENGNEEESRG